MIKVFLTIIFVSFSIFSFSQKDMSVYHQHIKNADSLISIKDYFTASIEFQKAFDFNEGKAFLKDRYNAACAFALSNNKEKSFYHLFYLAENPNIKYANLQQIENDSDFNNLKNEVDWKRLIDLVKKNKEELEKDYNWSLIAILDTINDEDQKYRKQIKSIEEEYGHDSKEIKKQWELIATKDSINLTKVEKILSEYGWLGKNIIGNKGNITLFLVIQHADIETQEKYLPLMKDAVEKGNASSASLALLEDRISLRRGGKQIYGSQIGRHPDTGEFYVLPLIDPDNVNERRTEVKLGKIENYIERWGIKWDVNEYKQNLPEYERLLEIQNNQ